MSWCQNMSNMVPSLNCGQKFFCFLHKLEPCQFAVYGKEIMPCSCEEKSIYTPPCATETRNQTRLNWLHGMLQKDFRRFSDIQSSSSIQHWCWPTYWILSAGIINYHGHSSWRQCHASTQSGQSENKIRPIIDSWAALYTNKEAKKIFTGGNTRFSLSHIGIRANPRQSQRYQPIAW